LNITILLLHWYPYSGPHTPIYAGLFRELIKRGHKITIISSFPHFRSGSTETWGMFRGKLFDITQWEDATLIRTYVFAPLFKNNKYALVYRSFNYLSFALSSLYAGLMYKGNYDIIITLSSPPLINGIIGSIISVIKHAKSVHNIVDIYPDIAEKSGILKSPSVLFILRLMEKLVYRLNSCLVVLSQKMQQNLEQKGVEANKIAVITDFVETGPFDEVKRNNEFSRRYGLCNHFVLMYAGNIGVPHGVEILLDVADLLKDEENVRICIVGRGEYKDRIVASVAKRGLSNVLFPPRQPDRMVPLIWASADVSVVTYKPGLAEYSVPSKLLFIMASGRASIVSADPDSDACAIVSNARSGINVLPGDAAAIRDAVLYLKRNPRVREEMGRRGQEYVKRHFDKMAVVEKFEKLFLELAGCK
jgi:colanic acid biosynthesis glycosyl transferase WcaI